MLDHKVDHKVFQTNKRKLQSYVALVLTIVLPLIHGDHVRHIKLPTTLKRALLHPLPASIPRLKSQPGSCQSIKPATTHQRQSLPQPAVSLTRQHILLL